MQKFLGLLQNEFAGICSRSHEISPSEETDSKRNGEIAISKIYTCES